MTSPFWRGTLRFDATKIAPEIAIRNTIGIALPLIVGAALGHTSAGVAGALGALNVSYSDSRDPYAIRARRMMLASVVVALAVTSGALSGRFNLAAIAATTLWAFAIGMLAALGPKAADLGTTTLATMIVFTARSMSVAEAFGAGALSLAGGLLQTGLSVAFWPVKPWDPERRVIRDLYAELARIALSPGTSGSPPPASTPITNAQETFAALARDRSQETERLAFLLSQGERIRLSLLTLRRVCRRLSRDANGAATTAALDRVLREAAAVLPAIGAMDADAASLEPLQEAVRQLRADPLAPTPFLAALARDAREQAEALAAEFRAAIGPPRTSEPRREDRFSRTARLRANLSLQSTTFRHAIRLAIAVGAGDALARFLLNPHDIQRTYWLPMTTSLVLKPDFTTTFTRGTLRIVGTLAGLLVATGLFRVLHVDAATDIALLTAFALFMRWFGPANYGLFTIAISGVVVLLVALTGVDPQPAIEARAINTSIGGGLAMVAYLAWPTWERTQTRGVIADLLDAYRRYFNTVVRAYRYGPGTDLDAARLKARLARSNAEASVARLDLEPRVPQEEATAFGAILVSSHAFAYAALAMESGLYNTHTAPVRPAVAAFAVKVDSTLVALAEALRTGTPPPRDLPELRAAWNAIQESEEHPGDRYTLTNTETDRIATSLETLKEQIAGLFKRKSGV